MSSSFMLVSSSFITDYSKALVILSFTESPKCESGESNGSPEFPSNGFAAQRAQASEEVMFSCLLRHTIVTAFYFLVILMRKSLSQVRLPIFHSWEIMWSGTPWMCGKQLKHYPSFCRNGTTIGVS